MSNIFSKHQTELKELKEKLQKGLNLRDSFENLVDTWIGKCGLNDDIWSADLSKLSNVHSFLLSDLLNQATKEDSRHLETINRIRSFKSFALNPVFSHNQAVQRIVPLNKSQTYIFIGDVHSDPDCLYKILAHTDFVSKYNTKEALHLVFTGDYVDRGKNHLETMSIILLLKYLFSNQVTLLQGNHDGGVRGADKKIVLPYRLIEEDNPMDYFPLFCDALAKENESFSNTLTDLYLEWFSKLPVLATVYQKKKCYLAVHGGLPRPTLTLGLEGEEAKPEDWFSHIKSLSQFTDGLLKDYLGVSIIFNMLWSDPDCDGQDLKLDKKRFRFTESHFNAFVDAFEVDYLIRGHEAHEEGVVSYFDDRVFTNFASGPLERGRVNKTTAYEFVKPHIIQVTKDGKLEQVSI